MRSLRLTKPHVRQVATLLVVTLLAATAAAAEEPERGVFVLTSTNDPSANQVVVFKLETTGAPALSLVGTLPTLGKGGAGGAGIPQFKDDLGAVGNYGSNSVSRIVRRHDAISIEGTIALAPNCANSNSVALTRDHLFVAGARCAESHAWPAGNVEGFRARPTILRSGPRSGTMFSDSRPAHSPDSFAIVNKSRDAISIFLTDGQGGVFYKSISLPGAPTDITVSPDKKWLAVIYSAGASAYVAVFSIDAYGDLTRAAASSPIGVADFSGVAISE
jgi:hypothetical protein